VLGAAHGGAKKLEVTAQNYERVSGVRVNQQVSGEPLCQVARELSRGDDQLTLGEF